MTDGDRFSQHRRLEKFRDCMAGWGREFADRVRVILRDHREEFLQLMRESGYQAFQDLGSSGSVRDAFAVSVSPSIGSYGFSMDVFRPDLNIAQKCLVLGGLYNFSVDETEQLQPFRERSEHPADAEDWISTEVWRTDPDWHCALFLYSLSSKADELSWIYPNSGKGKIEDFLISVEAHFGVLGSNSESTERTNDEEPADGTSGEVEPLDPREELIANIRDSLSGQSLKLFDFLLERKHKTSFRLIQEESINHKAFRDLACPSIAAIDKALKGLRGKLADFAGVELIIADEKVLMTVGIESEK